MWLEVKRGKTSGSGIKPIISARSKAPWTTYATKLIAQQENKHPLIYQNSYLNASVQWGVDMEEYAISAFTRKTGHIVEEVGWVEPTRPSLKGKSGCSPDGIITIYDWVEVKCLDSKNHIECIINNTYPKEYKPQILNYFIINPDLERVHFIMYDPRLKTKKNWLFVKVIEREDIQKDIIVANNKLIDFLEYKDELYNKYLNRQ